MDKGSGTDEEGDTDMGAARMRGTTEGGGMRAVAQTRQHRRGVWHGQEGQVGSTNEGWKMVANEGVAQMRRAAWMARLRSRDEMTICSGILMGAP